MSSFTDELVLKYIPKNNMWRTERSFKYYVGEEGSKDCITIPKGFLTDLASVPWPASMLIPRSGKFNQSAVLHDFLYHILGEVFKPYNLKKRTREECDKIFLEAMRVLGVNRFKRSIMYNAVRAGGWMPWNHHAKKNKTEVKK
jgi:hypothetical protein